MPTMNVQILKTAICLGSVAAVLLLLGLTLPHQYSVRRHIVINADSRIIHNYVNDLRQWEKWVPWTRIDPALRIIPGRLHRGPGAWQTWQGRDWQGQLIVTHSAPNEGIRYQIFVDRSTPMTLHSTMKYRRLGKKKTEVTWTAHGAFESPLTGGFYAMMMDAIFGDLFTKGLVNLKRLIEQQ